MPSPFPGMDPYLEGPRWHGFHTMLCVKIVEYLTTQLGPYYVALVEERVVFDEEEEVSISSYSVRPDAYILRESGTAESYGAGMLEPPIRMAAPVESTMKEHFVEVRRVGELELITAIEILSPSNKRGEGREKYLGKRRRVLRSEVNLIEVDLLRGGERLPMLAPYPPAPYFVLVHRASSRPIADVWPIPLASPLPTILVPLAEQDPDVKLDLQATFTSSYDAARYERVLNYDVQPTAPLLSQEIDWVTSHLAAHRVATT
jgi:hypothetical protein